MKFQMLAVLIMSMVLLGCGGQSGGLAPLTNTAEPPPTITDISEASHIKYGEAVVSTNGWEMSIDTTDPVEDVVLASGWSIEVKYE